MAATASSARRFVAPMTDDGSTALSVETRTNRSTSVVERRPHRRERPADVRVDGVGRVLLHHRHVLVGGGVEDQDRPVLREDPPHRLEGGDVGQARDELGPRSARPDGCPGVARAQEGELAVDVVERALGPVEQDQAGRVEVVDLSGELRSDRATGSGDQDRLTGHEVPRRPDSSMTTGSRRRRSSTWTSRMAAVLTGPDTSSSRAGTVLASMPRWVASSTARRITSPEAVGMAMSSRRRSGRGRDLGQIVEAAHDPLTAHHLVALRPVVVEKSHHAHAEAVRTLADRPQRHDARIPGPVDQGRDGAGPGGPAGASVGVARPPDVATRSRP